MTATAKDAAVVRVPPPLLFASALLTGWLLQAYVAGLPIAIGFGPRITVAVVLGGAGIVLGAWAIGLFFRTGQNPEPWKPTPEVVVKGVYRFTRNPMYLGMALLQAAIGIGIGNAWIVLLVPASMYAVYRLAIVPEEAYLESKFGDGYRAYKKGVRRWL